MKAALILDPLTSTTLAPPPTTRATNAAPRPGRTGCCGGGRGTPSTGQVCGSGVLSELGARGEVSTRGKVTLIQPDTLLCKGRVLDNPKLHTAHPSVNPCTSEAALWELPSVLSLETGLQGPAPDSLHHSCPPPHPAHLCSNGEQERGHAFPTARPHTAACHQAIPSNHTLICYSPGSELNRGKISLLIV